MIGKTYIITSSKNSGEIVLKYNLNGYLIALEITANFTEEQYQRIFNNFPYTETKAKEIQQKSTNNTIQELPADLSFERFYNEYANKKGKRVMAEKSWNRLSQKSKIEALKGIAKYNYYLATKPNIEKAYPSTYINQQYWLNDWN